MSERRVRTLRVCRRVAMITENRRHCPQAPYTNLLDGRRLEPPVEHKFVTAVEAVRRHDECAR